MSEFPIRDSFGNLFKPTPKFSSFVRIPSWQMPEFMWWCMPESGHCGAAAQGVRCTCALATADHDTGDEDAQP